MFISGGATIFAVCFAISIVCFILYLWILPDVDLYRALRYSKKEKFLIILSNILYVCSIWFAVISFVGVIILVISMFI